MCLVYFQNMTGTRFQFVPYRGAAPAMQDLLAGQIDLFCPEAGQTLSQYRAGSIKAYAVLTQKRWFAAPDVPTIDEAGVPGLHMSVLARPVGAQGHAEGRHRHAQRRGGGRARPTRRCGSGSPISATRSRRASSRSPEALAAYHKAEIEKWWPIIKAANIKLQ